MTNINGKTPGPLDSNEPSVHCGPSISPSPPWKTLESASEVVAQSYFDEQRWPLIRVLNWIAFRDVALIDDSSWRRLKHYANDHRPALVEHNPRRVLLEALHAGKIKAALAGKECSLRSWDTVRPFDLMPKFGGTTYLRDEVLQIWGIAGAEAKQVEALGETRRVEASTIRKGRPPNVDWQFVDGEIFRLMDHHGEFVDGDRAWNCQAKLEKEIASFIDKTFGKNAVKADSTIRDHTSKALEKWRKPKTGE